MKLLLSIGLFSALMFLNAFQAGHKNELSPESNNAATEGQALLTKNESNDTGLSNDHPAVAAVKEEVTEHTSSPESPAGGVSHQIWDALLRQYVSAGGTVDYRSLKEDRAKLEQYLDHLAANPVQSNWSRNEKMAYWINAYNAFTVKLIIDNYPLSSIRDLHGGNPWDVKWVELGNKTYTLNQIEHDILRPQFKDPRIHFAVNCAAASCPPLLNRAFTSGQLDQQLDRQATSFINNSNYNKLRRDQVRISKIFEWYRQDFGNLTGYLNKYADIDIRPDAKIEFLEYNWNLNDG
jgi:hypothetical protein